MAERHMHILNGDFAWDLWKECRFCGESLVWRETYLEGPLPATDDLHLFRTARADFLSTITGHSAERLYLHLQKLDESVLDLPGNTVLMLWFDSCIFDQTLLMRILYLLDRKGDPSPDVFLYCCDSNCLTREDFQCGGQKKIQLFPGDWSAAARAWQAFVNGDAAAMYQLADRENFERLPAMQKALLRCAEDVPDQDGLNRTRRQILQIVRNGPSTFEDIFRKLDDFEEYPFLGDTACLRLLDDLQKKGLLEITPEKRYTLTAH